MGNEQSDHREAKAYDVIKWIPGLNLVYGLVRAPVYIGMGNYTEAAQSAANAVFALGGPVVSTVAMLVESRAVPLIAEWSNWKDIKFKAGDVLYCQLAGPFAYHVLMATSDKDVIHFIGKDATGYVTEESWIQFHEREDCNQTVCRNGGAGGTRDYTVEESISKARAYLSKGTIYYNLLTCNCEHMVCSWVRRSTPYSEQSSQHVCQGGPI